MSQPENHPPYNPQYPIPVPPTYEQAATQPSVTYPPPNVTYVATYPPQQPVIYEGTYAQPQQPYPTQNNVTYTNTEYRDAPRPEDVLPSIVIFFLGWFGCCCIWLLGGMYVKSKNPTARLFSYLSLIAYGIISCLIILSVIIVTASGSTGNGQN